MKVRLQSLASEADSAASTNAYASTYGLHGQLKAKGLPEEDQARENHIGRNCAGDQQEPPGQRRLRELPGKLQSEFEQIHRRIDRLEQPEYLGLLKQFDYREREESGLLHDFPQRIKGQ